MCWEHQLDEVGDFLKRESFPHTRGTCRHRQGDRPHHGIIPAYAGGTRWSFRRRQSRRDLPACAESTGRGRDRLVRPRDHPRMRGEHRSEACGLDWSDGSSPHARGALLRPGPAARASGIIPAYAGSTSTGCRSRRTMPDHPRIRGEHLDMQTKVHHDLGSSPHTRGALGGDHLRRAHDGIIPAYAGSTEESVITTASSPDHPRIRGEHAMALGDGRLGEGSSPHTRGARGAGPLDGGRERIIPAYAGSTRRGCRPVPRSRDHPRIRGEHRTVTPGMRPPPRSSPHARGAPPRRACRSSGPRDHPRIRGEHTVELRKSRLPKGSSPHTRGAHVPGAEGGLYVGIIPAYAGSTGHLRRPPLGVQDHPRIRGEHRSSTAATSGSPGSSPHTRGAQGHDALAVHIGRIIPSYAGSTLLTRGGCHGYWDHPRIRGEHLLSRTGLSFSAGSSPHTRGALDSHQHFHTSMWIIPAYAGSTSCRPI